MQRMEADGVVISCDFCGTDWDEVKPMIEGHHGSVLCLDCVVQSLEKAQLATEPYSCTLCLRDKIAPTLPHWQSEVRPVAVVCQDCIRQAAGAFDRDPDVDWNWVTP